MEVEVGNGDPKNNSQVAGVAAASTMDDVVFSNAEKIVWDWQAIALTSAVFACILFFLVMTLYSLHQARQWRRLKENFEAGESDEVNSEKVDALCRFFRVMDCRAFDSWSIKVIVV